MTTVILLALALSMDAFAASLSQAFPRHRKAASHDRAVFSQRQDGRGYREAILDRRIWGAAKRRSQLVEKEIPASDHQIYLYAGHTGRAEKEVFHIRGNGLLRCAES